MIFLYSRCIISRSRKKKSQVKTDEQIAYAVKCGRREGQDLMVGRYGQEVFTMIARMVPDRMDAEELAQDTFLRAFRNIGSYDSKQASLSTWLCRIAYRLTLNFLKRSRPYMISIEDAGSLPSFTSL